MGILMWDKPKRAQPVEDWAQNGFEDGPAGGYIPNMSDADAARWKAKLTGTKKGFPQVEIRKTMGSAQLLVIVNLGDGYNYKSFEPSSQWGGMYSTKGVNVHMSTNGALQMTFDGLDELHQAVAEARAHLENLKTKD